MKNLKKVLALVLAFACAFTMFAGAVVYPDVPAGSEYSEAITMLSDLGIIQGKDDGKYHSEDTITRAEACALIARMLTGDPQVSQYAGASNFTDVVKGSWKESVVGYCVVNGITVGVGNNKFEPDRAITDAEFVTMVVRAMGYETTGTSYPYGHISAAQANGLLDDVTVVPSSAALRGEDAQIIYNALFADYARGAKQINTTHGTTVEEYPTIAEDVFGLYRAAAGTWGTKDGEDVLKNCKAHTWVITDQMKYNNKTWIVAYPIEDDDTDLYDIGYDDRNGYAASFEYDGDIDSLKGYQVELWGEGQHGEPTVDTVTAVDEAGNTIKEKVYAYNWEIKAVKTVKGQTAYAYTPADEELPDVDNDEVRGFVGGTVLKAKDRVVLGSKTLPEKDVEGALQTKNSASYTLIDWDSDGATDFIVGDIYDYYKVESVTKKTVKLVGVDGEKFTLDLDGKTDIFDYFTIKAELPSDLEEGDILEVSTSERELSKKNFTWTWTVKVVDVETKELTKVDTKKGAYFDDELIHDAEKYNNTKYYFADTDTTYDGLNEKSEDDWDLYRDANGFIIFMEVADESWTGYIFVTGAENGENRTGNRYLPVISGVNDKNEFMEDVKVAKDADIEGFYSKDDRAFRDADHDDNDGEKKLTEIVGKVFKYKMNDDGQITKMVEVSNEKKAATYAFTDKTDALEAAGEKNWADKASVLFAVKVTATEYTNTYNNGIATGYGANVKDLDEKNVMAVSYDDIPDIGLVAGTESKTQDLGVTFDRETKNDNLKAVVLGVNTFRYFSNTTVKAALVTKMTYHKSSDTYTLDANVAGEDATEFDTVDADDVYVNGVTNKSVALTNMYNSLTNKEKYGLYCEIELDKDGKVIALTEMNQATALGAMSAYQIENNPSYKAVRAVVNKVTADKSLTISTAITSGDNKVYTVENGEYTQALDLKDDTAFFKITDEKVKLGTIDEVITIADAFKKGFGVEEGSADNLDSYIDNDADDVDDYVVADVIVDDEGDVVAVYYYEKTVEEYKEYDGSFAAETTSTVAHQTAAPAVAAQKQVDTITVAQAANQTKTAAVTFNGNVTVNADITTGDTAASVAAKIADALQQDARVTALVEVKYVAGATSITVTAQTAGTGFTMVANGNECGAGVRSSTTTQNRVAAAAKEPATAKTVVTLTKGAQDVAFSNIKIAAGTVIKNTGAITVPGVLSAAKLAAAINTAIGTNAQFNIEAVDNTLVFSEKQTLSDGDKIVVTFTLA